MPRYSGTGANTWQPWLQFDRYPVLPAQTLLIYAVVIMIRQGQKMKAICEMVLERLQIFMYVNLLQTTRRYRQRCQCLRPHSHAVTSSWNQLESQPCRSSRL